MSDAETSGQYLRMAEAYEALADNEAKIASNSETKRAASPLGLESRDIS
jgi:hypothetical protein